MSKAFVRHNHEIRLTNLPAFKDPGLIGKTVFQVHIGSGQEQRFLSAARTLGNKSFPMRIKLKGLDLNGMMLALSDAGPDGAYFGHLKTEGMWAAYGWLPQDAEQGEMG